MDEGELLEFASLGSYLEYDLFGVEILNYPFNLEVDMPSDSQRVKAWVTLLLIQTIFFRVFLGIFCLKHKSVIKCAPFSSVIRIITSLCS